MSSNDFQTAILTKEQNECVNFNAGDLLVRGVAGSGKSYVILKRAVKLYKGKKSNESVAIFTYTNSLVKYTDDLISEKLGEDQVEVLTVDSYCMSVYYRITGRKFFISSPSMYAELVKNTIEDHQKMTKLNHRFYDMNQIFFEEEFKWIREKCIKKKEEYLDADRRGRGSQVRLNTKDKEILWNIYMLFIAKAKQKKFSDWPGLYMALNDNLHRIPEDKKIDYILLDEAQDMTVGQMKVMKALSKQSLTIAADIAQKIYKKSFTWKEVGIDISGRSSKSLSKSFRSTKQIVKLAEDLMSINRKNNKGEYTEAVLPEAEGNKPRLVRCSTVDSEKSYVAKLMKTYLEDMNATIGVIVRTDDDVCSMKHLLYNAGISEYQVVDKKKEWSLLTPGIKIVKAHSSKGLEFDYVIIPSVNDSVYPFRTYRVDDEQIEEYLTIERNILYVAMTRARKTLVMTCQALSASRFISEFKKEHYEDESL